MSARYRKILDLRLGAVLSVDFMTVQGKVVDYSVLLLLVTADGAETIRVYDSAHGYNEMHRYVSTGGKQDGVEFHSGTLAEGMRAAIDAIEQSHLEMIDGWRRQ